MMTVVAIIARCIEINRALGLISIAVINDFLNVFDNFGDIFTNTGLDIRSTYLFFMCSITSFLIVSLEKKKKKKKKKNNLHSKLPCLGNIYFPNKQAIHGKSWGY
jgi:hypothetical protein